jgi:hypothetical protein
METSIIHSFEYLNQRVEVEITQLRCGQHVESFVIKVVVKSMGREVSPMRANDLRYFSDLVAAKTAGEALGRKIVDASRDSPFRHRFRESETRTTR